MKLAGTFKPERFDQIRRSKTRDVLDIKSEDFEWINPETKLTTEFQIESVTPGLLKLNLLEPLPATF